MAGAAPRLLAPEPDVGVARAGLDCTGIAGERIGAAPGEAQRAAAGGQCVPVIRRGGHGALEHLERRVDGALIEEGAAQADQRLGVGGPARDQRAEGRFCEIRASEPKLEPPDPDAALDVGVVRGGDRFECGERLLRLAAVCETLGFRARRERLRIEHQEQQEGSGHGGSVTSATGRDVPAAPAG